MGGGTRQCSPRARRLAARRRPAFLSGILCDAHARPGCQRSMPTSSLPHGHARSVAVVVLGDVGRSPRMQYHATSLATLPHTQVRRPACAACAEQPCVPAYRCTTVYLFGARAQVSLVGFAGEACVDAVVNNAAIQQFLLTTPFAKAPRSLFLLYAPFKVLFQVRLCCAFV